MKSIKFEKTGRIIFAPVCSNCKHMITEIPINYEEKELNLDINEHYHYPEKEFKIEPERCPKCGSIFTSIIAPGKFPVIADKMFE